MIYNRIPENKCWHLIRILGHGEGFLRIISRHNLCFIAQLKDPYEAKEPIINFITIPSNASTLLRLLPGHSQQSASSFSEQSKIACFLPKWKIKLAWKRQKAERERKIERFKERGQTEGERGKWLPSNICLTSYYFCVLWPYFGLECYASSPAFFHLL